MHLRTRMQTIVTLGFIVALAATGTASAEEPRLHAGVTPSTANVRPVFDAARTAAAQQPATATTQPNDHQFGVGLRLGGTNFGVGASVRYFFYAGPLGVQAEVSRSDVDFLVGDFNSVQFAPSAIYRFQQFEFESPVSLVPYAGLGLSFVHSNFSDNPIFDPVDDTDVGVQLYGGVELFFDRVPNLGASGQLTYNSNDDVVTSGFGAELGGVSFTGAAHWYFW